MEPDFFGAISNEVDDPSDQVWAVQNFLVLIPNIFAIEPGKIVFLGPLVKYIGTWISAGNVGLSETRNAPNWNVSGTRDFLPHCAVFQSNKRNRALGHDYPFVFENVLSFNSLPLSQYSIVGIPR